MSVLLGHCSIQAGTQVTMVWDALDIEDDIEDDHAVRSKLHWSRRL